MKLYTKVIIALVSTTLLLAGFVVYFLEGNIKLLNEQWGLRQTENQLAFDKYRTLSPILSDLNTALAMARDPDVINMALDESNPAYKEKGIAVLEKYRLSFAEHNFFAAFKRSQNYYSHDRQSQHNPSAPAYTLDENNPDDQWFYTALKLPQNYQINVNKDTKLGTIKVWINVILRHQGEVLGVIGSGMDLAKFIQNSVSTPQNGVDSIFVNRELGIQLAEDQALITYASLTKLPEQQIRLDQVIKSATELYRIETIANRLFAEYEANQQITSEVIWLKLNEQKHLMGITYIPELDWFCLSIMDHEAISIFDMQNLLIALIALLLLTFVIYLQFTRRIMLQPLDTLNMNIERLKRGDYDFSILKSTTYEINKLFLAFKEMAQSVHRHQDALEQGIQSKTRDLENSKQLLETVLNSIPVYIYIKDSHYRYNYINKYSLDFFGKTMDEVIGKKDEDFFDKNYVYESRTHDRQVIELGKEIFCQEKFTDKDGNVTHIFNSIKVPLRDLDGAVYAMCGITFDVTAQQKRHNTIKVMAYQDALTSLANRHKLEQELESLRLEPSGAVQYSGMMFLDLDNFKPLNDQYGHKLGDKFLVEVASRILGCVRHSDTVSRFGGDEFVLLLPSVSHDIEIAKQETIQIARKVLAALAAPYHLETETLNSKVITHFSSVSIGVMVFNNSNFEIESVIKEADSAMYYAKAHGKNQVHLSPNITL